MSAGRISADFSDDLKEIAFELFNSRDRAAQRKVHYWVNELPEEERPRGLFKVGSKCCMWRSILRADLQRRARGEPLVLEPPTLDLTAEPPPLPPPSQAKPAAGGDDAADPDALTAVLGVAPQP